MRRTILAFATIIMVSYTASATCKKPTAASVSTADITCPGTGSVTVNSVTDEDGDVSLSNCRYALYDAADQVIVKPVQLSQYIGGLAPGSYVLHIYQYCSSTDVSADYTQQVQIGGSYTAPVFSSPVTEASNGCANGSISIAATQGSGAYSFCLVDSMNAPITPASYVRSPQASGDFNNLPAGDYYVRVYDACNFVTRLVTVPGTPATTPFGGYNTDFQGCDGYVISQTLNWYIQLDANNKMWVNYPDNTVDTLSGTNYPVNGTYFNIPFSKLTTYPATVTLNYKNPCGVISSKDYTFNAPGYSLPDQRANNYTCGMGTYSISTPYLRDSFNNVHDTYNIWDAYSTDGGITWIPYVMPMNDTLLVAVGDTRQVIYRRCGVQYPITVYGPDVNPFDMRLYQTGNLNCPGNASIRVDAITNGEINKVWVEVTSMPAGQAAIPSFFLDQGTTTGYPLPLMNLLPGTYTFHFTDECGDTVNRSITLTPSHETVAVTPQFSCGSNKVALNISYTRDQDGSYFLNYIVYDHNNNEARGGAAYGGNNVTVDNLDPDIYTVKIWKSSYSSDTINTLACAYIDTVDASLPGPLSVNRSSYAICTNAPTTGMIIANAQGGIAPYTYTLYQNSISAANQVGQPQTSNVFSSLDVNTTYIIVATDLCGAGASYYDMFSNVQPVVATSTAVIPCYGDSITLSVSKNSNLFYQWTKNGIAIPGAIDSAYSIESVAAADSGVYSVNITSNNCLLLSTATLINPNDCGIPFPLPIELMNFNGTVNAQQNAVLNWKTAHEERNTLFSVWYSTDGTHFNKAGAVPGNATGNTYSFTHSNYKLTGKTYYKLLLTDATGTDKYSPVIVLKGGQQSNSSMEASPVPFTTGINVTYTATGAGNITLQLTDVSGRVLKTQSATVAAGVNAIGLHGLDALPNGTYFLKATDEAGQIQALKVQK